MSTSKILTSIPQSNTFHQRALMEFLAAMGCEAANKGICAGISQMWVQSVLTGDEKKFQKRCDFLKKQYDIISTEVKKANLHAGLTEEQLQEKFKEAFKEHVNSNLELVRNRMIYNAKQGHDVDHLSQKYTEWFDAQAFFDPLRLWQLPALHDEVTLQHFTQENIAELAKFTESVELEKRGGLKQIYSEPVFGLHDLMQNAGSRDLEINEYFKNLAAIFDTIPGSTNLPLTLGSFDHRIGLRYLGRDPSGEVLWSLVDPNKLPEVILNSHNIGRGIHESLAVKGQQDTIFELGIFTTGNQLHTENIRNLESALKSFRASHEKNVKNAIHLDSKRNQNHYAYALAYGGHTQELLKFVDENKDPFVFTKPMFHDQSILKLVSYAERKEAIIALGKRGIPLDEVDNKNRTMAHFAAANGKAKTLEAFNEFYFDYNRKDLNGTTPMHAAVAGGHFNCIQALAKKTINYTLKDNQGFTPLAAAIFHKNWKCTMLLLTLMKPEDLKKMKYIKMNNKALEQIRNEFQIYIKTLPNDEQLKLINQVLKGENALGKIVKPTFLSKLKNRLKLKDMKPAFRAELNNNLAEQTEILNFLEKENYHTLAPMAREIFRKLLQSLSENGQSKILQQQTTENLTSLRENYATLVERNENNKAPHYPYENILNLITKEQHSRQVLSMPYNDSLSGNERAEYRKQLEALPSERMVDALKLQTVESLDRLKQSYDTLIGKLYSETAYKLRGYAAIIEKIDHVSAAKLGSSPKKRM